MMPARRPGHSLVELVVATCVGGVFLALLAALLTAETRLARMAGEHVARQEAVRVAWSVLSAELRYLVPGRDVHVGAGDSIAVRAPRGVLLPCAADDTYVYHGMREPDPAKDSLVAVLSGTALPFRAAAAPPPIACGTPPPGPLLRLAAPASTDAGEPLLLFEAGAYHVQARALRYRLGAEGRQPLTGEWFDAGESRFIAAPASDPSLAVSVRLAPRVLATSHAAPAPRALLRLRALNGGPAPHAVLP